MMGHWVLRNGVGGAAKHYACADWRGMAGHHGKGLQGKESRPDAHEDMVA